MATHLDKEEETKKYTDFLKASKKAAAKSVKATRQEPEPAKEKKKKKKPPKKKSKATAKGKGKKGR